MPGGIRFPIFVLALAAGVRTSAAFAQESEDNRPTESSFHVRTYARLSERASAPGPGGSIVTQSTQLPVTEHVSYWAGGLDTLFGADTAELEVAGYQSIDASGRELAQTDLQTALITLRSSSRPKHLWLSLGRQVRAGGAARFARFDGATLGVRPFPDLSLRAYGGYRVLPRFDQRPGYHHLGATSDVLLTNSALMEPLDRSEFTMVGGSLDFHSEPLDAALSFHDETDGGALGRRNLGIDAMVRPVSRVDLGASLLLDLDALKWSTARAFVDYFVTSDLELSAQFLRAEPALLLSKQSVLSVFSTDAYREFGLGGRYRLSPGLSMGASAWGQGYDDGTAGARLSTDVRAAERRGILTRSVVGGYTRVLTLDGGYHSIRGGISEDFGPRVSGTVQSFVYVYDEAIYDLRTSMTHGFTLDYDFFDGWNVLWGASIARSPYAYFDASTQLRLSYALYQPGGAR